MKRKLYKHVVCADGFKMSVQANDSAYCSPRKDGAKSYTAVEVGFPNAIEPLLMPHCEDESKPSETVYGYVPAFLVATVIAKHGGIVEGEVPPGVVRLESHPNTGKEK